MDYLPAELKLFVFDLLAFCSETESILALAATSQSFRTAFKFNEQTILNATFDSLTWIERESLLLLCSAPGPFIGNDDTRPQYSDVAREAMEVYERQSRFVDAPFPLQDPKTSLNLSRHLFSLLRKVQALESQLFPLLKDFKFQIFHLDAANPLEVHADLYFPHPTSTAALLQTLLKVRLTSRYLGCTGMSRGQSQRWHVKVMRFHSSKYKLFNSWFNERYGPIDGKDIAFRCEILTEYTNSYKVVETVERQEVTVEMKFLALLEMGADEGLLRKSFEREVASRIASQLAHEVFQEKESEKARKVAMGETWGKESGRLRSTRRDSR